MKRSTICLAICAMLGSASLAGIAATPEQRAPACPSPSACCRQFQDQSNASRQHRAKAMWKGARMDVMHRQSPGWRMRHARQGNDMLRYRFGTRDLRVVPPQRPFMAQRQRMHAQSMNRLLAKAEKVTLTGMVEPATQPNRRAGHSALRIVPRDRQQAVHVVGVPARMLADLGLRLKASDQVAVDGWKIMRGGKSLVIARQLTVNGKTITVRDENGKPAWRPEKTRRNR